MINLYPGPSQLFHSVRDHIRHALKLRLPELPADGNEAADLIQQASQRLRELLSIPPAFDIYFLPASDIIRERIVHDLVHRRSTHFGHGDLSRRLYESAIRAGVKASLYPSDASSAAPDSETELIALTHTEETGTFISGEAISQHAHSCPQALIAIDAGHALPYASLPFGEVDTVFLDFHFGFGLPVGLAAWIVNEACFERNAAIHQLAGFTDSIFSLENLRRNSNSDSASKDINLLMIATLNGVLGDMLSRGIATIRKETEYKAALLYHLIANHPLMTPAVSVNSARSRTIITADCGTNYHRVVAELQKHAVMVGTGHGEFHDRYLVLANFPTHSREQYERVADILMAIR